MSAFATMVLGALIVLLFQMPSCTHTQIGVLSVYRTMDNRAGVVAPADGGYDSEQLATVLEPKAWDLKNAAFHKESVLILYVNATSAWMMVDPSTTAATHRWQRLLCLSDSRSDAPDRWENMNKLWDLLRSRPKTLKVVCLDLARVEPDWRIDGFGTDSFTDFAQITTGAGGGSPAAIEDLKQIENLVLMTSGAPGERSWPGPDRRSSAFLHFLVEGLKGDADKDDDKFISLQELLEEVPSRTRSWVRSHRDRRGQNPQIFLSRHDRRDPGTTYLVNLRTLKAPKTSERKDPSSDSILNDLNDLTATWFELNWDSAGKPRHPEHRFPVLWRRCDFWLDRTERCWINGQIQAAQEASGRAKSVLKELNAAIADSNEETPPMIRAVVDGFVSTQDLQKSLPLPRAQLESLWQQYQAAKWPVAVRQPHWNPILDLRDRTDEAARLGALTTRRWQKVLQDVDDRRRRRIEDAFFNSGGELSSDQSKELDRLHQTAEALVAFGEALREARACHQELLAWLPLLSDWAARRIPVIHPDVDETSDRVRILIAVKEGLSAANASQVIDLESLKPLRNSMGENHEVRVLQLFEETRRFSKTLEGYEQATESPATSPSPDTIIADEHKLLRKQTESLSRELTSIRQAIEADANPILASQAQATQQIEWRQIVNLLGYRGLSAKTRQDLRQRFVRYENDLSKQAPAQDSEGPLSLKGDEQNYFVRHHRLWSALWALNSQSLTASPKSMSDSWDLWRQSVAAAGSNTPDDDLDGGHGLSIRLAQKIRERAQLQLDEYHSLRNLSAEKSENDCHQRIWECDLLARGFPGFDAEHLANDKNSTQYDIAAVNRERWMRLKACTRQAQRFLDDFYGSPPGQAPWFQRAAEECLQAATRLENQIEVPKEAQISPPIQQLLSHRVAAQLRLEAPAMARFGLEKRQLVKCQLQSDRAVPDGMTKVRLKSATPLAGFVLKPLTGPLSTHQAGATSLFDLEKTVGNVANPCNSQKLQAELWFRGHGNSSPAEIVVDTCEPKSVMTRYSPPAERGSILVHGQDVRTLMFVLDCSGSMGRGRLIRENPKGFYEFDVDQEILAKRFTPALNVLNNNLTTLSGWEKVPRVGLVAFAHRVVSAKGADKAFGNAKWSADHIRKHGGILPDMYDSAIKAQDDFQVLSLPLPLKRTQLDNLRNDLSLLGQSGPFGATPLLGAIDLAARKIDPEGGQGRGTVVVITDGAATDDGKTNPGDEGEEINRIKPLIEMLKRRRGVELCLVGFGLNDSDRADIASLIEGLEVRELKGRVRFLSAPTAAQLGDAIKEAVAPLPYKVTPLQPNRSVHTPQLGEVANDLEPGMYEIKFPGLDSITVQIKGGEQLVYHLDHEAITHDPGVNLILDDAKNLQRFNPTVEEPRGVGIIGAELLPDGKAAVTLAMIGGTPYVSRPVPIDFALCTHDPGKAGKGTNADNQPDEDLVSFSVQLVPNQSVPTWRLTSLAPWKETAPPPAVRFAWVVAMRPANAEVMKVEEIERLEDQTKYQTLSDGRQIFAESRAVDRGRVRVHLKQKLKGFPKPENFGKLIPQLELGLLTKIGEFEPTNLEVEREVYETEDQVIWTWRLPDLSDDYRNSLRVRVISASEWQTDLRSPGAKLTINDWRHAAQ